MMKDDEWMMMDGFLQDALKRNMLQFGQHVFDVE